MARPQPTGGLDGREDKISSNQIPIMPDNRWRRMALSWLYPDEHNEADFFVGSDSGAPKRPAQPGSQVNDSGDVRDSAVSGCSRVEPDLVPDQQPPFSPTLDNENESSSISAPTTVYEQWKLNSTIDAKMERNVRNAALFWRQVLERI
ncbi:hypothetical protein CRENBAI_008273, partial [Crenichthys baileyi]